MGATFLLNGIAPAAIGVTGLKLQRRSQEKDSLSIQFASELEAERFLASGDAIALTKDGRRIFAGKALPAITAGVADNEGYGITAHNAWWDMERLQFVSSGGTEPTSISTLSRLFLDQNGTGCSTQQAIRDLVGFAVGRGVQIQNGGLDLDTVNPPPASAANRMVGELIQRVLRWHPDVATVFDYSVTGYSALRTVKRGTFAKSFSLGAAPLAGISIQPRNDLVPNGVIIRYERGSAQVDVFGYREAEWVDRWPGNARPDDIGALAITLTLGDNDSYEVGSAKRLYEALALIWEGELTFADEDCDTGLAIGDSVNLTGGRAEWATMNAFVQEIEEDFFNGQTIAKLGLQRDISTLLLRGLIRDLGDLHHRDDVLAANVTQQNQVPGGAFVIYTQLIGADWWVGITPGTVDLGQPEEPPVVRYDGVDLARVPPPMTKIAANGYLEFFIKVKFRPDVQAFELTDAEGFAITEYRALGTGTLAQDPAIVTSLDEPSHGPEVNPESGEVTREGVYFFRLGSVLRGSGGAPTVSQIWSGSFSLLHVPPNRLFRLAS